MEDRIPPRRKGRFTGQAAPQQQWSQPLPPHKPYNPFMDLLKTMKSVLWSAGFISFVFMLFLSFIVVLAMTPEIQQWITTPVPSRWDPNVMVVPAEHIFIITPKPVLLFSIHGPAFQAWHFLMLGILTASVTWAKYGLLKNWLSSKKAAISSLFIPEKATSGLEGAAKLFMASISFSFAYFIFLSMIHVNMNTPDFASLSRPELIYGLFSASVFEELVSRVLLIGVPFVALAVLMKNKTSASKILGGGMGFTPVTLALMLISSVMFAFAHVGSWDLWKVPQVLVTGLALGWAFVRYGLHASILIHFSINLSSSSLEIWPDSLGLLFILGMVMLIWMVAGAYFFIHYSIEFAMKSKRMIPGRKRKKTPILIIKARREMRRAIRKSRRTLHIPAPRRKPINPVSSGQVSNNRMPPVHATPPPPPHWSRDQPSIPPPPWAYGQPPAQPPVQRPAYQPAPQPSPPGNEGISGGFICPKCGHMEASYDSGKLICLKCGTAHFKERPIEKKEEKGQIEF